MIFYIAQPRVPSLPLFIIFFKSYFSSFWWEMIQMYNMLHWHHQTLFSVNPLSNLNFHIKTFRTSLMLLLLLLLLFMLLCLLLLLLVLYLHLIKFVHLPFLVLLLLLLVTVTVYLMKYMKYYQILPWNSFAYFDVNNWRLWCMINLRSFAY